MNYLRSYNSKQKGQNSNPVLFQVQVLSYTSEIEHNTTEKDFIRGDLNIAKELPPKPRILNLETSPWKQVKTFPMYLCFVLKIILD